MFHVYKWNDENRIYKVERGQGRAHCPPLANTETTPMSVNISSLPYDYVSFFSYNNIWLDCGNVSTTIDNFHSFSSNQTGRTPTTSLTHSFGISLALLSVFSFLFFFKLLVDLFWIRSRWHLFISALEYGFKFSFRCNFYRIYVNILFRVKTCRADSPFKAESFEGFARLISTTQGLKVIFHGMLIESGCFDCRLLQKDQNAPASKWKLTSQFECKSARWTKCSNCFSSIFSKLFVKETQSLTLTNFIHKNHTSIYNGLFCNNGRLMMTLIRCVFPFKTDTYKSYSVSRLLMTNLLKCYQYSLIFRYSKDGRLLLKGVWNSIT